MKVSNQKVIYLPKRDQLAVLEVIKVNSHSKYVLIKMQNRDDFPFDMFPIKKQVLKHMFKDGTIVELGKL